MLWCSEKRALYLLLYLLSGEANILQLRIRQVFCTSPEVHSPTLLRTGLARRKELAEVARHYRIQVLEDECYVLSGCDLPSYRALLPKQGWYVSSLSKNLSPSLRLGYLIPPKSASDSARRTSQHSFFGVSLPMTQLAAHLLGGGEARELANRIGARIATLVQIAVNQLGCFDLKWRQDVSFLWLSLPQGWRASTFCRAAEQAGVLIRSADDFTLLDGRPPHAVRIAVNGQVDPACFEAALGRLRQILSTPSSDIEV